MLEWVVRFLFHDFKLFCTLELSALVNRFLVKTRLMLVGECSGCERGLSPLCKDLGGFQRCCLYVLTVCGCREGLRPDGSLS